MNKMLACLPLYTPKIIKLKQKQDLEACENYLTYLEAKWRTEGEKTETTQTLTISKPFLTNSKAQNENLTILSTKYQVIQQAKENLKNNNPAEFKKTLLENFHKLNIKRDNKFNQFLKAIGICLYEKFYDLRFNLFRIRESRSTQSLLSSITHFQTPKMAF